MSRLDDIESHVSDAVTGGWAQQAEDFRRAVLSLWSVRGQTLAAAELQALLGRLRPPAPVDAPTLLLPAAEVGNDRIAGQTTAHLADSAVAALRDVHTRPAEALADAGRRLRVADLSTLGGVLAAIAPVGTSVHRMQAAASYATHAAANEAVVSAAAQAGADLVFVPERDACLECTGYAGETPGPTPPIHAHCRCELHPYVKPETPMLLKREAVRSVLRGFSLPSESESARLRAAADLLRHNPTAPASVKNYARAAVRRGKFPRGRNVP